MTPIVFLDCETTGVHRDRQVWEIAMIRRDDAGERETSFFVDVDLSNADPFGLSVGRFYERHPEGLRLAGAAADQERSAGFAEGTSHAAYLVARWTHGAHIVGLCPWFDTETLDPLLRKHGLIPAWHHHLIDVETMAVGYLAGRDDEHVTLPWKSDELSRWCDVEPPSDDERHTALGDAKWALRWHDKLTGGTP